MRVLKSRYSDPTNSAAGYYVQVAGTRSKVTGEPGRRLAKEEARDAGWDPASIESGGMPSKRDGEYRMSYWFYEYLDGVPSELDFS